MLAKRLAFLVRMFADLANARKASIALLVFILNLNSFLLCYTRGNVFKDVGYTDARSGCIVDFDVYN
jgi:hypothetical protein